MWAFFAPSWFPKDFAPLGVLPGYPSFGGSISLHKLNLLFLQSDYQYIADYLFDVGRGLFLMVNFLSKKSLPQNP